MTILAQVPDMVGLPLILNLNQKKSDSVYNTLSSVLAEDFSQQGMPSSPVVSTASLSQSTASSLESLSKPQPLGLAQGVGGNILSSTSNSDDNESSPFGEFIFGLILICLALPMVWMNERK